MKTKYIFIALGFILLCLILWYFKSIVAYILIASILSLIGNPLVDILSKIKINKFFIPRTISAIITLFVLWIVLIAFFRFVTPLFINEANELASVDVQSVISNLNEPLMKVGTFLERLNISSFEDSSIEETIAKKLVSILNISNVSNIFGFLAGMLGNIFIAFFAISFVLFFFLKDNKLFANTIILMVPVEHEKRVEKVLISIKNLLSRYFIGICLQISLIIILITVGLCIVGLDFGDALIIGLIVGLMNIIPYIGPMIGAVFGIVIGIATNLNLEFYSQMIPLIIFMAIVFAIVQIIDNVLFQPLIYSKSVKAHPLEIFIIIMMAGSLAGITGMILAIPTYTILRVIAKEFFNNFKIIKKLTENI
ncbi:MAG: AI-2E family transporter [Bacteroidales bacterium]|nr:AI-2E family transporter [Bacteroidales bacterium]